MIQRLGDKFLRKFKSKFEPKHGWFGEYSSWQEATAASEGYDSGLILNKVLESTLKVINTGVGCERDSVYFEEIEYSWPLAASLLFVAAKNGGELSVVDFGGALGSSYFQNRRLLNKLDYLSWCVVEQSNFVSAGNAEVAHENLRFFESIEECIKYNPSVALLSGVLPYLESPYEVIEEVYRQRIEHLIVDRTPFISGHNDRLTVQIVPPKVYAASYPAWFLSESKFKQFLRGRYRIIEEFHALDKPNIKSESKGFLLELIH